MTILAWIAFGLVVGFIARAIMPGRQSMGLVLTTVLGVVGSFVGGLIANLLTGNQIFEMHATGFIGSILGALGVLLIARLASGRRHVAA